MTKRQVESAALIVHRRLGDLKGRDILRAEAALQNGVLTIDVRGEFAPTGPNGRPSARLEWTRTAERKLL